jgi:pilus assembly protein CpaE
VMEQIRELRPDVLMVDALLQGKINGLDVTEQVRQAGIDIPIICLTVPQKPIRVGQGMGIVKVLSMPFSGFDFMNMLQAAHAEHRATAPEALSRVYCVFAAKGGVGKTTIAFNLAVAVAQLGGYKVALIDGSLQFADLRTLLRVPDSAPTILQLPTDRVAESELAEVLWRDPSGIDILLAPPRPEMAEMVTPRDIEKALSLLRRVYNVVIIDTPTTVNDAVLAFFDASDGVIQVVTYDSTTIHNTRVMMRTFEAIGFKPERVRYLANRSDATGGIDPRFLVEQLGRAPDFTMVSDGKLVVEANNQGIPFVLADATARVSQDMMKIAAALVAQPAALVGARR